MNTRDEGQAMLIVAIVGLLILVGITMLALAWNPVQPGEVELVKRWGAFTGEVQVEGLNWLSPFAETTQRVNIKRLSYETSNNPDTSKADYTDYVVTAQTTDGQQIEVGYTVLFKIPPENAIEIWRGFGGETQIVENIIKANSRNLSRVLAQNYQAEELYSGEGIQHYEEEVQGRLETAVEETGVALEDFLVRKIDFDPDYVQAIENQQIAQEAIRTAEFNAEAAEYEKQQAIRAAEAERERNILLAQAEAEQVRLKADAEAYSIETRGEALRDAPELVQWEFIQQLQSIDWMILPDSGVTPLLPLEGAIK